MKELSKKELHAQLTDQFIKAQVDAYLSRNPDQKIAAALYAAGRLQSVLLSVMTELPYDSYHSVMQQLKG